MPAALLVVIIMMRLLMRVVVAAADDDIADVMRECMCVDGWVKERERYWLRRT